MRSAVLEGRGIAALDASAWSQLSARALASNPFYGRAHVLAGLETIENRALRAVAVWRSPTELSGLFPFHVRGVLPFPWPVAEAAANRYQFCGQPLVDANGAAETIGTWLDTMRAAGVPRFWSLGDFDLGSPLVPTIGTAAARRGLSIHVVGQYRRPRLTRTAGGFAAHVDEVIPHRRLREIERSLRRLREAGTLTFERATDAALVAQRVEDFLALEHAGWKGRQGTSFLSRPADAAFARAAYRDATIDSLLLDGKPIATSINLAAGRTAFTPKCTYDERWRRHAPGLVLEHLAIERFYEDTRFDEMDAATTVDGHVVSEFWNDSKRMGRLILGPADWRTEMLVRIAELRLALQASARQVVAQSKRPAAQPAGAPVQVLARARSGTARLLTAIRASMGGLFALAMLALPGILIGIKRHEPLAYGIAGL